MRYGTVASFFPEKGFGFIRPERGDDIFFHRSMVIGENPPKDIPAGQPVKYDLIVTDPPTKDGKFDPVAAKLQLRAEKVEIIDRIPGGKLSPLTSTRHPRSRRKKPTWRTKE